MNGRDRTELEAVASHGASLAHIAAGKLHEATTAVRRLEAALPIAFLLVAEAQDAARDAGLEVRVGMSPEAAAAYNVWQERDLVDDELEQVG